MNDFDFKLEVENSKIVIVNSVTGFRSPGFDPKTIQVLKSGMTESRKLVFTAVFLV